MINSTLGGKRERQRDNFNKVRKIPQRRHKNKWAGKGEADGEEPGTISTLRRAARRGRVCFL